MMNWKEYKKNQKTHTLIDFFINYNEYGDRSKETIICIHGIPTWGYIFHDLAVKLAEDYHVLVPDLRGYGFSDKRDNFDRATDKQATYLIQWMNELKIDMATVIGHDIGGGVALRLTTSYQDRLNKLCLMNCVSYDS
jgi:pimeloyl-ACP methyl ester carboxylesterase